MEKFRNKYRIPSTRLKNWDYSAKGLYFLTIITKNRKNYFGEIVNKQPDGALFKMQLTEIGEIVEMEWMKTPEIRPDMNLSLDEYIVMPNHFHAILGIGENQHNTKIISEHQDNSSDNSGLGNTKNEMEAIRYGFGNKEMGSEFERDMIDQTKQKNKYGPQSNNLASVVRGFKSSVTTYARFNNITFNWHPRFYEHIIRDYDEYTRISSYIKNNPANWKKDIMH